MAVTFGRLGTITLNRGVNLTVTPEFKIIAPSAPAADVTPIFTPGWVDYVNDGTTTPTTENQTITSITVPIQIYWEVDTAWSADLDFSYSTNDGTTWNQWSSLTNITVTNNSTIKLQAQGVPGGTLGVFIKNASDNNTTLVTMLFEASFPP
jgi:hypothetical protein